MPTPTLNKIYTIQNWGTGYGLNLYNGTVTNGTNVCQWKQDRYDEDQRWKCIQDSTGVIRYLCPPKNTNYCLDRYNLSTNPKHNNADLWQISSAEAANQKVVLRIANLEKDLWYIILESTKDSISPLYLTADVAGNGSNTEAGKKPGAAGNVYWRMGKTNVESYQWWRFWDDISGGGSTSTYHWPTISHSFSQGFGNGHDGVDIKGSTPGVEGDPVYAFMDGTVSLVNSVWTKNGDFGNEGYTVRLHHVNPLSGKKQLRTQYMHLREKGCVTQGQSVKAGQVIGYMGNTGNSSGPHLHFETRVSDTEFPLGGTSKYYTGELINPMNYLNLVK